MTAGPGERGFPGPDRAAVPPYSPGGGYTWEWVHKSPDRQAEMPSIRAIASSAPYGCKYGSQRGSL